MQNALRHAGSSRMDSVPHIDCSYPPDIVYFPYTFCCKRSIFSQHFHVCRSTEYLGGCLWSGSPGAIHLTGNEQCVNVYMKGPYDKVTIYFYRSSHQAKQWVCVRAHQDVMMKDFSPCGSHKCSVTCVAAHYPLRKDGLMQRSYLIHIIIT